MSVEWKFEIRNTNVQFNHFNEQILLQNTEQN